MAVNIFSNSFFGSILVNFIPDARLSERHVHDAVITEQAIEDGSPLINHIINRPKTVEIDFVLTNIDPIIERSYGIVALTKINILDIAREQRKTYTIVTRHTIYFNMAIQNLSFVNENSASGALEGTIKFIQVSFNSPLLSLIRQNISQDGTQVTASKTKSLGQIIAKEVNKNSEFEKMLEKTFGITT